MSMGPETTSPSLIDILNPTGRWPPAGALIRRSCAEGTPCTSLGGVDVLRSLPAAARAVPPGVSSARALGEAPAGRSARPMRRPLTARLRFVQTSARRPPCRSSRRAATPGRAARRAPGAPLRLRPRRTVQPGCGGRRRRDAWRARQARPAACGAADRHHVEGLADAIEAARVALEEGAGGAVELSRNFTGAGQARARRGRRCGVSARDEMVPPG